MTAARLLTYLGLFLTFLDSAAFAQAAPPEPTVLSDLDLSGPFATRLPWHFTAVQGAPIDDPFGPDDGEVPGAITLCLSPGNAGPCDPQVTGTPPGEPGSGPFSEPHYLREARIVFPRGRSGPPLLLVATASLNSGDGDQLRLTQLLSYRHDRDRFVAVYKHSTGTNNNQEIRYVEAGPLKGDVISAEPTENAPFGFWITVHAPAPHGNAYATVLRFRSGTIYGDGNPLPVIDSEMPSIQRRLGLWRPGTPPPLPNGPCAKPHLVHLELWCG